MVTTTLYHGDCLDVLPTSVGVWWSRAGQWWGRLNGA